MIEVFKIIHNYYDAGASVKLNFYPVGSTRGNKFKLRKDMCRYDIRKYSVCYRVVNVWISLPDSVVGLILLIPSKIGWINTGPIKSLFLTLTNSELMELEVYQFVCNGIKLYTCMVCRRGHRGYI